MKINVSQWLIATAACIAFVWHQGHESLTPMRIAGAVICLLAFGLVSVARYQLGRAFSVTPQARHLVTTGLYSRIRNPIYLFAELFLAGAALYLRSWWPVLFLVAAIPLQIIRARKEASVLEAAFGDEYRQHRAHSWL